MNKKNNTVKHILERIEKENLQPKAKWRFVAEHTLLWVPGIMATVLGGFAVSIIIFDISHAGWEYWGITHRNLGSFFADSLPYLWILILIIFLIVAIWRFKKTDKGYKYSAIVLVGSSVLISLMLGIGGFAFGIGEKLDRGLSGLPIHKGVEGRDISLWVNPEDGRLAGLISDLYSGGLEIYDFDGQVWQVKFGDEGMSDLPFLSLNKKIRIVGFVDGNNQKEFTACILFPFEKPRPGMAPLGERGFVPRFGFESERKLSELRITKCSDLGKQLHFYKPN